MIGQKTGTAYNEDGQIYCCRKCPWGPALAYLLRARWCRLLQDPGTGPLLGEGCDWPKSGVCDPHCSSSDWTHLKSEAEKMQGRGIIMTDKFKVCCWKECTLLCHHHSESLQTMKRWRIERKKTNREAERKETKEKRRRAETKAGVRRSEKKLEENRNRAES